MKRNSTFEHAKGKRKLSLIPLSALEAEAFAFEEGAKHGPWNWRHSKVSAMLHADKIIRHLQKFIEGEDVEPISGKSHLGCVRACAGVIIDAKRYGMLIDDRPNTKSRKVLPARRRPRR